jgi:agmatinase
MHSTVVIFPFDLFGSGGTGAGAQLLGDALREAVEDTEAEDRPTRPRAYAGSLEFEEHAFDTLEQVAGWRATGREAARRLLAGDDGFTLWLAGNHLGVLPVYEELGADSLVVQFDAHLDCYQLHDTTEELCHGNFLLHAEGGCRRS